MRTSGCARSKRTGIWAVFFKLSCVNGYAGVRVFWAIFEAVARGWCSPKTENQVMDPILGEAIAVEVIKLLQARGAIEPDPVEATC